MSHDAIADFAQRYGIPPEGAEELAAMLDRAAFASIGTADPHTTWTDEVPRPGPVTLGGATSTSRYQDIERIGRGGMGEVRRVLDVELNRVVAMKSMHAELLGSVRATARFVDEAQATARLQHPNVVPLYDAGTHDDGRAWFTMREIEGQPMSKAIVALHAGEGGWTFRRLVAAFLQVCNAIAYAHDRGVIHRDLKPDNVMLGEHGQVYLVDWGLAKQLGRTDHPLEEGELDAAVRPGGSGSGWSTQHGTVTGTPVYMSPEQARGEVDRIDTRSDVYGLGAILYEILSGRAPYDGKDNKEVVIRVASGMRTPLSPGAEPLPPELVDACYRAMAFSPDKRFQSASELATEVEAWLDGARLRAQAQVIVERAQEGSDIADALRRRASNLQASGEAALAGIEPWKPESDKAPGWAKQDEAQRLRREADLAEFGVDQGLQAALRVDPLLSEAHAGLAERFLARHADAEARRDADAAARMERLVRVHAQALPVDHPTRASCTAYLEGKGTLTIRTEPPGAQVELYRYELRNRRLVGVPTDSLGETPIDGASIPMGSYLCVITGEGRVPVRYPVEVPRQGHWHGVAPGDDQPHRIRLLPEGSLGEDEVYIPAGWFRSGGDAETGEGASVRLWCDGLVAMRFPVTNREYIAFLDGLVAQGRTEEALSHAPCERAGTEGERGALIYGFDGQAFSIRPDADGHLWEPDWPVFMVDWHGARAYLAWWAEQTGKPWRLPDALEWEKAARGVDGRFFPWGDFGDPSWHVMTDSHEGPRSPAPVSSAPVDVSPCGVRGLGGNVMDWCLGEFGVPSIQGQRVVPVGAPDNVGPRTLLCARGGTWAGSARFARVSNLARIEPGTRRADLGFRGIYPLTAAD